MRLDFGIFLNLSEQRLKEKKKVKSRLVFYILKGRVLDLSLRQNSLCSGTSDGLNETPAMYPDSAYITTHVAFPKRVVSS